MTPEVQVLWWTLCPPLFECVGEKTFYLDYSLSRGTLIMPCAGVFDCVCVCAGLFWRSDVTVVAVCIPELFLSLSCWDEFSCFRFVSCECVCKRQGRGFNWSLCSVNMGQVVLSAKWLSWLKQQQRYGMHNHQSIIRDINTMITVMEWVEAKRGQRVKELMWERCSYLCTSSQALLGREKSISTFIWIVLNVIIAQ